MTTRPSPFSGRVFVDTGAYYGLADPTDSHHTEAVALARQLAAAPVRLYTTNFVLAESHALILIRRGYVAALRFLTELTAGRTSIVRVGTADEQRAVAIIQQYSDKQFSYTDATSFAVMDRLDMQQAFTFDRNFQQYGLTTLSRP